MPRSRKRPKRSTTRPKVSKKAKGRKAPEAQFFKTSALSYDSSRTQFDNYKSLALMADANQIGAVHETIKGFKPRIKGPMAAVADTKATHPLELEAPEEVQTIRQVPEGERKVLLALIKRHGENHAAMARDMRLNQFQHTAAHLRRRIAKMAEEDAEDAAQAEAACRAGKPEPTPRLQRKATRAAPTRDPNPAFKNRSRNFT